MFPYFFAADPPPPPHMHIPCMQNNLAVFRNVHRKLRTCLSTRLEIVGSEERSKAKKKEGCVITASPLVLSF